MKRNQFAPLFGGACALVFGMILAPTDTIQARGGMLQGLVGRYAPMSVIQIGMVPTVYSGPTQWGHQNDYTMRTVDTQNNPYGSGDTYESFANVNPPGTVLNPGGGSHWPATARQPSPYNFHDYWSLIWSRDPGFVGDPQIETFDQIWHNTDKQPNDQLNTHHGVDFYKHSNRT